MKNNCYIVLAALLATLTGGSAEAKIPTLQPNTVRVIDFESDAILHEALAYEFIQATQPPMENTGDYEFADIEFTSESKKIAQECVWWAVGPGCSWYCGGGPDTITCSSQLPPKGGNNYACKHVHDLRFDSAWVEGAKGYGIGEWVQYHFTPSSPRITTIMVANGYSKSKKAWKENTRVKRLKLIYNGKPFCHLCLQDVRGIQTFKFERPFGNIRGRKGKVADNAKDWTLRFEIEDVYEGDKYDDTAISEIYFDGWDVH